MKNILLFAFAALFMISCKKQTEKITYPDKMLFGDNILAIVNENVSDSVTALREYSLGAKLGRKADLKIVFTNTSPINSQYQPVWMYAPEDGWIVGDYDAEGKQTFQSTKSGDIQLKIVFSGSQGTCKVDFYENSSTITKTRYLRW